VDWHVKGGKKDKKKLHIVSSNPTFAFVSLLFFLLISSSMHAQGPKSLLVVLSGRGDCK